MPLWWLTVSVRDPPTPLVPSMLYSTVFNHTPSACLQNRLIQLQWRVLSACFVSHNPDASETDHQTGHMCRLISLHCAFLCAPPSSARVYLDCDMVNVECKLVM